MLPSLQLLEKVSKEKYRKFQIGKKKARGEFITAYSYWVINLG
jgi:hypothetical protein